MLALSLTCLLVALVAGIMGFGGVAIGSAGVAQAVFFIAVAGFTCTVIANALRA
jgi:uncharacterized membrane protein YtjA (UPF0391 family)